MRLLNANWNEFMNSSEWLISCIEFVIYPNHLMVRYKYANAEIRILFCQIVVYTIYFAIVYLHTATWKTWKRNVFSLRFGYLCSLPPPFTSIFSVLLFTNRLNSNIKWLRHKLYTITIQIATIFHNFLFFLSQNYI